MWKRSNLEIITNPQQEQVNRKEKSACGIHGNCFNSVASELHKYQEKIT